MFLWKSKKLRKQKNLSKGSEAGRNKSANCQADWRKKFFAKVARSYKDRNYEAHLSWAKRENSGGRQSQTLTTVMA